MEGLVYKIKSANSLSDIEYRLVLIAWNVAIWKDLSREEFEKVFNRSEFHLVYNNDELVALCRIFYDFRFSIQDLNYQLFEMTGLISFIPGKGYGQYLMNNLIKYLQLENIMCIGFCSALNRGFYDKCGIKVLEGKAKFFNEFDVEGKLVTQKDDDIILVNVDDAYIELFSGLSEQNMANLKLQEEELKASLCMLVNGIKV